MEKEIWFNVPPGAVITAVTGEVEGRFMIWHVAPGTNEQIEVDPANPLVIRLHCRPGPVDK